MSSGAPESDRGIAASDPSPTLAAIDLGSNSFHMMVSRLVAGVPSTIDRLREPVRLGAGLDEKDRLTPEIQQQALECLERFGQRVRDLPSGYVRAVGTNTLRRAKNSREFLAKAQVALGHSIEIISGQEEARLIYLGISQTHADSPARRLVVDIGGGSTEVIVGNRSSTLAAHSLYMGCVTYSQKFFVDGVVDKSSFKQAIVAARLELRAAYRGLRNVGWSICIGASGTINAIGEIVRKNSGELLLVDLEALKRLRKQLIAFGHYDQFDLPGLREDRKPVLAGGLAILIAVFESLEIDQMLCSRGTLREGVIFDLLGRIRDEDVRDRTVRQLVEKHGLDVAHSDQVKDAALMLLDGSAEAWDLTMPVARQFLGWAADVHEIGMVVAYRGHHKHGAYLIQNSDMPGFSAFDQAVLASLVRGQRRKLSRSFFADLPLEQPERVVRLCILLRLAVVLNRGRNPVAALTPKLTVKDKNVRLRFPAEALASHAMTREDLDREHTYLEAVGYSLVIEESGS